MLFSRFAFVFVLVVLSGCGSGGGGDGAATNYSSIFGLTVDNAATPNKLVIANADNQTLQTLTLSNNAVAVLAGTANTAGTVDGTGTAAKFNGPFGIALSGTDYYVADFNNHAIRKVTSAGVVSTLAGSAGSSGSTDGTGAAARFYTPKGLVSDGTNLFVTDTSNHTIRQVVIGTGVTTTLAGGVGASGTTNATGTNARFNAPFGIAFDTTDLFVTDTGNHTIRKLTTGGVVTTLAGTAGATGATDATGAAARFNTPSGIVSDGTNLFVADSGNHTIRKVVIATGVVTTLAGTAGSTGATDGTGAAARFNLPIGLTIDNAGNLYVSDQNYTKIRKIVTSTGVVTTISATF